MIDGPNINLDAGVLSAPGTRRANVPEEPVEGLCVFRGRGLFRCHNVGCVEEVVPDKTRAPYRRAVRELAMTQASGATCKQTHGPRDSCPTLISVSRGPL